MKLKLFVITTSFIIINNVYAAKYPPVDTTELKLNSGQAATSISTSTTLDTSNATDTQIPTYKAIITNVKTLINGLSSIYQPIITGAATTITNLDLTGNRVVTSNSSGKIAVSTVTDTTLSYLDATSSVQGQLNAKQATITGAASTIVNLDLDTDRVLVSNSSGKVEASAITTTLLNYLSGLTGNIQNQLNSFSPLASAIVVDTSAFSGNLSAADDTAQKAFNTLDAMNVITNADIADTTGILYYNNATSNYKLLKVTGAVAGYVPTYVADGTIVWAEPPGATGGEANTASNTGSAGTGIFKQKAGVDLEFYKLNSLSNLLSIALDGTDKVDFNLSTGNNADSIVVRSANNTIATDIISEISSGNGITVDNLSIKDGGLNTNTLNVGTGTDTDIAIHWNNGDANKAGLRYDSATNKNQFSNDGSTWTDMGSGGGGITYTTLTNDDTMAVNSGYINNKSGSTCTLVLPATSAVGDVIEIFNLQNQTININSNITADSQSITDQSSVSQTSSLSQVNLGSLSTQYGMVKLICGVANKNWYVYYKYGTFTPDLGVIGNDAYTKLLLHMDADFADVSAGRGATHTPTVSNATINTSTKYFGAGSGSFNGSNTSVTYPYSTDFDFGTGAFTIDFWMKPADTTQNVDIIGSWNNGANKDTWVILYNGGKIYFAITTGGSTATQIYTNTTATMSTSSWTHVECTRDTTADLLKIYINGTLDGSQAISHAASVYVSSQLIAIGTRAIDGGYFYNGLIDEVRITKGLSRHTSNFTPPTAAYGPDNP